MNTTNAKKILKLFIICAFAAPPARLAAQTMRYVAYFPVPHAYYKTLDVSTLALLATRGLSEKKDAYTSGEVVIGSSENMNNYLKVNNAFSPYNLTIHAFGGSSEKDLGGFGNGSSPFPAVGIIGVVGNVAVKNGTAFSASGLVAYDSLIAQSLSWEGASGSLNATSCASLAWRTLQLPGTDSYRTYLTCN